jgi:hypothetical protein
MERELKRDAQTESVEMLKEVVRLNEKQRLRDEILKRQQEIREFEREDEDLGR